MTFMKNMPSKKPSLQITLEEDVNQKLEYIQKETKRSRSNLGRYIIEKYIAEYETEFGEIPIIEPRDT